MLTVNLTTTSDRLDLCSATIWSIIQQDRIPDKIILWLSHEAYLADKGIKSLPKSINNLLAFFDKIEVKFTDNIGPYRKIIPALRNADCNEVIVYADDDVIYGKKWLYNLEKDFLDNNGNYVIASRIRIVRRNFLGIKQSYNKYPLHFGDEPLNKDFIITGVGGCILMKKHIGNMLINDSSFMKIAPKADDLWISKIIEVSGTSVKSSISALGYVQEINHAINCLSHGNTLYFKGNSVFTRFLYRAINFFLGYFGLAKSNNDIAYKNVHRYFLKNK